MNDNLNRWDESGHKTQKRSSMQSAAGLLAKFWGLSTGVKIALAIVALVLFFGIAGTVLGWIFSAFAFVGRLLLLGIVAFLVVSWLKSKKK